MKKILLIFLLGISRFADAQYNDNAKEMADKAFAANNFFEAAYYYKKAAEGMKIIGPGQIPYQADNAKPKSDKPGNREFIIYRLAESYRLYENYLEAEPWYARLLSENADNPYPLAQLWYGVSLRANQRFDEAIHQLTTFNQTFKGDRKYPELALKEIANCKFAKEQYQNPQLLTVTKLKGSWNQDGSDYAMASQGNTYWFTSSRSVDGGKKHLNKIYSAANANYINPKPIEFNFADQKKDNEFGTVSFNSLGSRIYFTRWYKEGNKTVHAIYSAIKTANGWSAPKMLNSNVNAGGFSAIQPFITANDKELFFVSNKPGGQGGYDIWMSNLDNNGDPVNSFNLGSTINTPADEQSPWYDEAGQRLVYGSKGFEGLGGFDLFESNGSIAKWTKPVNLGFPINSAKDDLYYLPDHNNKAKCYLSSDRESDCCLNLFEVTDKRYVLAGKVTDCNTNATLAGVSVSLVDSVTKQVLEKQPVKNAVYSFKISTKRLCFIYIEKQGYFSKTIPVKVADDLKRDTLFNPDICLQKLNIGKPIVLNNILYDFAKASLRQQSNAVLDDIVTLLKDNPTLKIEISAHTDAIGSDAYNLKLSQTRAQACVDYLISKGIDESRVFAKGYGKSKPVAPNTLPNGADNPYGRQLNRRTAFTVLKSE